jgi:hypothetical protein
MATHSSRDTEPLQIVTGLIKEARIAMALVFFMVVDDDVHDVFFPVCMCSSLLLGFLCVVDSYRHIARLPMQLQVS